MHRLALLPLLIAGNLQAATWTWTPKVSEGDATPFSAVANWSGGTVPGAADVARFTEQASNQPALRRVRIDALRGAQVGGIRIDNERNPININDSLSYQILGGPLTLGAQGIAGRTSALTLSDSVLLSADQTWNTILSADGAVHLQGHRLTFTGGRVARIRADGGSVRVFEGDSLELHATDDLTLFQVAGTLRAGSTDVLAQARVTGILGGGFIGFTGGPSLVRIGHFDAMRLAIGRTGHTVEVGGLDISGTMDVVGNLSGDGALRKVGRSNVQTTGDTRLGGGLEVLRGQFFQNGGSFAGDIRLQQSGSLRADQAMLNMQGHRFLLDSGRVVQVNGGQVSGGELSGAGQLRVGKAETETRVDGLLTRSGSTLRFMAGSNTLSDARLSGKLVVEAQAAVSTQNLDLRANAEVEVLGQLSVRDFESPAALNLKGDGRLQVLGGDVVLNAGSRTWLGSATAPGGSIDLSGNRLQLYGALLVNNGRIEGGTTHVHYGSLAKGAGYYEAIEVHDGGRLIAGNSPGVLQVGSAVWGEGGRFDFQLADALAGAGTGHGLLAVEGVLSIQSPHQGAGRFLISLQTLDAHDHAGLAANFDASRAYRWTFAQAARITGFDAQAFVIDRSSFLNGAPGHFSVTSDGQALSLVYAPVPEPGAALLMALGLAGLSLRARRLDGSAG